MKRRRGGEDSPEERLPSLSSNRYHRDMRNVGTLTEADILARVILPEEGDMTRAIAKSFLSFSFDRSTTKEIETLLRKNHTGTISADERIALDKYLRVGQFLDLMRAKA
jgi:hypothetical protein